MNDPISLLDLIKDFYFDSFHFICRNVFGMLIIVSSVSGAYKHCELRVNLFSF